MLNYIKSMIFRSVYFCALWNFLVVIALFMLCRMLFWALNANLFPDMTASQIPSVLAGGLRFDLSALAYGNALWLLLMLLPARFRYNAYYQKACKAIFIACNAILLAANCLDFAYFRYTQRRTTIGVFTEFAQEQNYGSLALWLVRDFWYVFLIWFALIAALVLCYRRAKHAAARVHPLPYYAGSMLALAAVAALCAVAMRGGITNGRPIAPAHAQFYVKHAQNAAIVLNTPFTIMRSKGQRVPMLHYFSDENELQAYYNPVHAPSPADAFVPKNIVLVILEGFGRQLVGSLSHDAHGSKGYTPFLDSLLEHSLTFSSSYANGTHSNEAVPSIAAGLPSMRDEPFVQSIYSVNKLNSLPSLLACKGYNSSFFHGAFNGSFKIDECAAITGFERYYGKTEYGNDADYDGVWGIPDEEFLQYFAMKLDQMQQPFCTAVFTISSHGPYKLPPRYDGKWADISEPSLRCVRYTDYSLRRFFERVRHSAWYANTIFVIVADHWGNADARGLTSVERMAIPIIYHAGDGSLRGMRHGVTQQSDILPTILTMLNYDKPYIAFGRNALDDADSMGIAVNYIGGVYQVFSGKYVMLHDGERILGLHDLNSDKQMRINKLDPAPPPTRRTYRI
jgi:phosphoglycerol transferase MdoB-like AlkP superfamily enzyme